MQYPHQPCFSEICFIVGHVLNTHNLYFNVLQAEKAKQLLYQAKYGRFGLGDPFVALQRDAVGTRDSNFDEAAVKSMYDNQLAQLENLIATQRKAQLKMREQLANAEKRYHKVSWLKAFIFEHSVFVFLDKTFES